MNHRTCWAIFHSKLEQLTRRDTFLYFLPTGIGLRISYLRSEKCGTSAGSCLKTSWHNGNPLRSIWRTHLVLSENIETIPSHLLRTHFSNWSAHELGYHLLIEPVGCISLYPHYTLVWGFLFPYETVTLSGHIHLKRFLRYLNSWMIEENPYIQKTHDARGHLQFRKLPFWPWIYWWFTIPFYIPLKKVDVPMIFPSVVFCI